MVSDFRIRPLADRVVVKPADREAQTKGGIFLPDTASKERPTLATLFHRSHSGMDVICRCVKHSTLWSGSASGQFCVVFRADWLITSQRT